MVIGAVVVVVRYYFAAPGASLRRSPRHLGDLAGIEVGQGCAGLGELAHGMPQALEKVDRFGKGRAGGGEVAAQGV